MKNIIKIIIILIIFVTQATRVYAIEASNLNWLIEKPIAHRGLHNKIYPENSMLAFRNAIENGYSIELDVHLTKDKQVVVIHDENLERLTGDSRKIKDITYDELKKLKLLNSSESIPLFKEVLTLVGGKVPMLIEIKTSDNVIGLATEVNKLLQGYRGDFAIQSFNTNVIEWYAKNAPHVAKGMLMCNLEDKNSMKIYNSIISNSSNKADFISMDVDRIDDDRIQQLRRIGYPIIAWTIQNEVSETKANTYANNFIFDNFTPKSRNSINT